MLRNKKGLTLVELMAVMAIFILLLSVLYSFFAGAQRGMAQTRRVAYCGQAAERALTVLRQELAGAMDLDENADGLLLYTRVRDPEDLNGNRDFWRIEVINRQLVRQNVSTGATVVMARDIDEFQFSRNEGPRVLAVTVRSGELALDDTIYLRNTRN